MDSREGGVRERERGGFRVLMDGHDLALQDETTDPYLGGCCVRLRILEYDLRTHDGEIDRPSFLN